MAFPADYTLLRKIPIDATAVSGSNDDFTGLITEAAFKLSKAFIFANTDNGGGDVRLSTDEAGLSQIALELVSWDTSGETCELHYLADGVDDVSPTDLYIWGDNAGDSQPATGAAFGRDATWASRLISSHLDESSGSTATDSAGNRSGTYNGTLPGVGTDFGQELNGTSDYVNFGNAALGIASAFTFTLKIKPTSIGVEQSIFQADDTDVIERNWQWRIDTDGTVRLIPFDSGGSVIVNMSGSEVLVANTEYIVNFVFTGSAYKSYINGVEDLSVAETTQIGDLSGSGFGANVGARKTSGGGLVALFGGQAGSLEIMAGAFKSADFIATEHSNQSDVSGFYLEPVDVSGGISITPDAINSLSVSNDPSISFASILNILPVVIDSASVSIDPLVEFKSIVIVQPQSINSLSVAQDPTIQFSSVLSIIPQTINSASISLDPVIDFTSVLSISPQTINSLSISKNPLIEFKSVIDLFPQTVNSLSVARNPIISTGQQQTIGEVTASFKDSGISVKYDNDIVSVGYKPNQITVNFK